MLEMLNPAISAIHHESAADPTECIAVMGQAFQSISWEAIANVPSYGAWWRAGDARRVAARLGALAVAIDVLQFGWFADHVFGVFAAPGTLLQAAWFVVVGVTAAPSDRAAVTPRA